MRVIIRKLKQPEFTHYPLSDVHWPRHNPESLDEWMKVVKADPNALVTLGGDLFDFARGHFRSHLQTYSADETSIAPIDEQSELWVDSFAEYLAPIAGKIALTVVGNHFWRFRNGQVSDQRLALKIGRGATFAGNLGLARVDVPYARGKYAPVTIALHHDAGKKGGTEGADLMAFIHWSRACRANIYAAGHTHEQWVRPGRKQLTINADDDKLRDTTIVFIRSGAFAKGYGGTVVDPEAPYQAEYPEVRMLAPAVFGIVSAGVRVTAAGRPMYHLSHRLL